MTIAALVVAIVALLISIPSVWYTRVQGRGAKATLAIESGRLHKERTPGPVVEYAEEYSPRPDAQAVTLRVRNEAAFTLHSVAVAAVITDAHRGFEGIWDPRSTGARTPLVIAAIIESQGDARFDGYLRDSGVRTSTTLLRFTVSDESGSTWTVSKIFDIPPPIENTVY